MEPGTPSEIVRATGRALCEHGYAGLTMQRIADESSLTTAAIHYHFDTKRDLLNAFLEDLISRFERRLACDADDSREQLATFLDAIFAPTGGGDDEFPVALLELKAQAPYEDPYRARFLELDETMRAVVERAVREGVDAGHFDDADPASVAQVVVTVINGGFTRMVTLGEDPTMVRGVVEDLLDQRLGWAPGVVR